MCKNCRKNETGMWSVLAGPGRITRFCGGNRVVALCVPVAGSAVRQGLLAVFFCVGAPECQFLKGKKKTTYRLSKKGSMHKKKQVVIA